MEKKWISTPISDHTQKLIKDRHKCKSYNIEVFKRKYEGITLWAALEKSFLGHRKQ